jgi:PqqD family protein of HPr-rel-A system
MPALKPKVRPELSLVQIDGEAVLYDPENIDLHHLNPSAALIFQLCDGSGTVKELAQDIADELGLPHDETLRQVRRVVKSFKYSGILTGKRPLPPARHTHTHQHENGHEHG